MFSLHFMLFQRLKNNNFSVQFFFQGEDANNFFNISNIEKCPFIDWLNGRWFLQIVDRDSGNLPVYPIYPLFPCSDFFISNVGVVWGGGGGGVMFFSHFMLFPIFLEN